jgi:glycosyltransferase involved in cell wall biosynthesis
MPEYFPPGTEISLSNWLKVITKLDGAICVSQSTANELEQWMTEENIGNSHFEIDWVHNGADIVSSIPTKGIPDRGYDVIDACKSHPTFIMVGTLEPRKGHKQVVEAFSELWNSGVDANLLIVGKKGWMVDQLASEICQHEKFNTRLYWVQGASDEYLEELYDSSDCLIAASYGEGFGLPIIEAAQHGLAIFARDIPVFVEVAGTGAFYFSGDSPKELSKNIIEWLKLYSNKKHPDPCNVLINSWEQSVNSLLKILLRN